MARLGFGVLVFQLKDAFGVGNVAFLVQVSEVEILLGYFFCYFLSKSKLSCVTFILKNMFLS